MNSIKNTSNSVLTCNPEPVVGQPECKDLYQCSLKMKAGCHDLCSQQYSKATSGAGCHSDAALKGCDVIFKVTHGDINNPSFHTQNYRITLKSCWPIIVLQQDVVFW